MDGMSVAGAPIDPDVLELTHWFNRATPADIMQILAASEIPELLVRRRLYTEIKHQIEIDGALSYTETARRVGCSRETVDRGWKFMKKRFAHTGEQPVDLRLVIPGEGRASDQVDEILAKAGFVVTITNNRLKTGVVIDMKNGLAPIPCEKLAGVDIFRDLERNKDTPFDLAFVGKDVIKEYKAQRETFNKSPKTIRKVLAFHHDRFRMCIAVPEEKLAEANKKGWRYFDGKSIVTSYPHTTLAYFREQGVEVDILDAKGGVEQNLRRWKAVAIVDVEETGNSLIASKLVKYRKPLYTGNISLIEPRRSKKNQAENADRAAFLMRLREAHP